MSDFFLDKRISASIKIQQYLNYVCVKGLDAKNCWAAFLKRVFSLAPTNFLKMFQDWTLFSETLTMDSMMPLYLRLCVTCFKNRIFHSNSDSALTIMSFFFL